MSGTQVVFGVFFLLLLFIILRRAIQARSITRYAPSEVEQKLRSSNVVLLDVRTAGERSARHIKNSIHIPLQQLAGRLSELDKHKSKEIICYCQSGSRSIAAAIRLKRAGFHAADMRGGIAEWHYNNR